jgi:hypothetical protein
MPQKPASLVPVERVQNLILLLRGERVLLGQQLADLYGVPVKALIQAVKRNRGRFPEDFMFQLSNEEFENLKSQFVTSSWGGLRRALPYAFTEQGVAMLSSVLRSDQAVQVNVAIMRAFVNLRRMLAASETLSRKLVELERRLQGHDQAIISLFDAIRQLMKPDAQPRREMGFHTIGRPAAGSRKTTSRRQGRADHERRSLRLRPLPQPQLERQGRRLPPKPNASATTGRSPSPSPSPGQHAGKRCQPCRIPGPEGYQRGTRSLERDPELGERRPFGASQGSPRTIAMPSSRIALVAWTEDTHAAGFENRRKSAIMRFFPPSTSHRLQGDF